MNTLVLASLLCLVCSILGSLGMAVTFPTGESGHVLGTASPGEVIQTSVHEDLEFDEDPSGGAFSDTASQRVQHLSKVGEQGKGRKRQRNKKKNKSKGTTAHTPGQSNHTPGRSHQTYSHSAVEDPCATSHQDYCIHGQCKYMEDLREPVCFCTKGYDGERCGIQLLKTKLEESDVTSAEVVQTVLVVIAVVLSIISCSAVLLMISVHYKTHRSFQAAYLGPSEEKEKLQKNNNDIMV